MSEAEWERIAPLIPAPLPGGRPAKWPRREIVNAIVYVLRTGCQWHLLPHDFPHYSTVFWDFRQWRRSGLWEQVNTVLREQVRIEAGREAQPSAAIIDSQSVKTTEEGGTRGFDGGKQVKGRKRHILVDTMGNLLKILVHSADLSESQGGCRLLERLGNAFSRLKHLWTDQGYKPAFVAWVHAHLGWTVELVKVPYRPWGGTAQAMRELLGDDEFSRRFPTGFRVLPRRWVVERTLAWLNKQRRLSKDYEFLPATTEAWCYLTMSRLMLRRLVVSTA